MTKIIDTLSVIVQGLTDQISPLTLEVQVLLDTRTDLQSENSDLVSQVTRKKEELQAAVELFNTIDTTNKAILAQQAIDISTNSKAIQSLADSSELITSERNKIIEPMDNLRNSVLDITTRLAPFVVEVNDLTVNVKNTVQEIVAIKDKTSEIAEQKIVELDNGLRNVSEREVIVREESERTKHLINKITSA